MTAYADMPSVLTILNMQATNARLDKLNTNLSALLDRELGRTFGATEPDRTETGVGLAVSPVLPLSTPVRSVTSVTLDGEPFTAYALWATDRDGLSWGLTTTDGTNWSADTIAITGQWGDQPYDPVPPAITEAVTLLVAFTFKSDEAGPQAKIGPDETPVFPKNPWNDERVKRAIDAYRLAPVVL